MNAMRFLAPAVAACVALAVPQSASAQSEWPMKGAEYVEVTGITVNDGHALDYANHLATLWRQSQDFARSQGWITDYEVLMNMHPRKGEPDVYLITRFVSFPDSDEEDARSAAYMAHVKSTEKQMQAASGERANYRAVDGTKLLRRMVWK